jgi:hypothetical protein
MYGLKPVPTFPVIRGPSRDTRPSREGLAWQTGRSPKKNSTSATQNTPNQHLSIVTILDPTHPPPEPRPAFACKKGILIPPQTRRAGRTVPHILRQNSVEDFVDDPDEEPAPSATPGTPSCPTLAATVYKTNAWMPPCNSSCRWAPSAAKRFSGKDRPHTPWSPTDADINQPGTYHAYHAYHAPFPSAAGP